MQAQAVPDQVRAPGVSVRLQQLLGRGWRVPGLLPGRLLDLAGGDAEGCDGEDGVAEEEAHGKLDHAITLDNWCSLCLDIFSERI